MKNFTLLILSVFSFVYSALIFGDECQPKELSRSKESECIVVLEGFPTNKTVSDEDCKFYRDRNGDLHTVTIPFSFKWHVVELWRLTMLTSKCNVITRYFQNRPEAIFTKSVSLDKKDMGGYCRGVWKSLEEDFLKMKMCK